MITSRRSGQPYHHGNLAATILDAADRQVATGGLGALVARELARTAGVSSAAVYRHFPDIDHLRAAVGQRARETLAARMIAARDAVAPHQDAVATARARLEAIGRAYLGFALDDPGRFDAAFGHCAVGAARPDDPDAWAVLCATLDELVVAGALTPARREAAPLIAWTSIHGLAALLVKGALPRGSTVEEATTEVIAGMARALDLPA
ncbi:MAG: hypothetical protein RL338_1137 [Chloroflexota bacterium]|jgi:AcrR family transcriptional regulator